MALYPPIVASSMPAFGINSVGEGTVTIYFTLSNYNNKKDIEAVQVTVRRQSSNANVLRNSSEILLMNLKKSKKYENTYYIKISNTLIIGQKFESNVFYKVQLRFKGKDSSFSEWSTVCLIKPVIKPNFYIQDFETEDTKDLVDDENIENFYSSQIADFVGVYDNNNSGLKLKSWRLRLLTGDYESSKSAQIDKYTLVDSGENIITAYNYILDDNNLLIFTCNLPYEFKNVKLDYQLLFEILTRNGYIGKKLIPFTTSINITDAPKVSLGYSINEEDGYIKVNIRNDAITSITNLVLRRTDSSSNFLKWEDLKFYKMTLEDSSLSYYDFTAQSGTLYKYLVQSVDTRGRRSYPVYAQYQKDGAVYEMPGVIAEYEHSFLLLSFGNGDVNKVKQLKLKFDFQISSYKYNVLESKTDTIGSQYPFIKRNGDLYYRSFDCTGTITGFMDDIELLVSKDDLYDGKKDLYDMFRGLILNYTEQYDYTYERKFREKVEEFLYNSKPKLYKSMQEGNMLVKLMNVSLTPKNELGRLIYTFSANVNLIASATIENYINYGLLIPGTYDTSLLTSYSKLGQLNSYDASTQTISKVFKAGKDIIGAVSDSAAANSIAKSVNYNLPIDGRICTDFNIDWLRITVESSPYLIIKGNNGYRVIDDNDSISDPTDKDYLYQFEKNHNFSSNELKDVYLGTLFKLVLNGEVRDIIIAPPNNIYEINESNLILDTSCQLIPQKDTLMTIDYHVNYFTEVDESTVPIKERTEDINGQLMVTKLEQDIDIIPRIKYKYLFTNQETDSKIQTSLVGVKSILIDTLPGTKVRITIVDKTANGEIVNPEEEFVVNFTGELNIDLTSQSSSYIKSYIILDSTNALVFYYAILKKDYYA